MRSRDIHKIVGILFDKGEVTLAQTLAREVTSTLLPDLNIGIRSDKVEKDEVVELLRKRFGYKNLAVVNSGRGAK